MILVLVLFLTGVFAVHMADKSDSKKGVFGWLFGYYLFLVLAFTFSADGAVSNLNNSVKVTTTYTKDDLEILEQMKKSITIFILDKKFVTPEELPIGALRMWPNIEDTCFHKYGKMVAMISYNSIRQHANVVCGNRRIQGIKK